MISRSYFNHRKWLEMEEKLKELLPPTNMISNEKSCPMQWSTPHSPFPWCFKTASSDGTLPSNKHVIIKIVIPWAVNNQRLQEVIGTWALWRNMCGLQIMFPSSKLIFSFHFFSHELLEALSYVSHRLLRSFEIDIVLYVLYR